jgi:hypothetical protein
MFRTEFHGTEMVTLTADPTDVFALLVDVHRLPEWNDGIDHVIDAPPARSRRAPSGWWRCGPWAPAGPAAPGHSGSTRPLVPSSTAP